MLFSSTKIQISLPSHPSELVPSRGKRSSHRSPFPFARWWNSSPIWRIWRSRNRTARWIWREIPSRLWQISRMSYFVHTKKVQYNTHRIHGAAIYGNIYHQYTPNVSIYIYTIHGSCGIVQKSGILHDHMYRSGRDLPRQSRALRPGRLVMASIVSGVIIYRPHKLMCIYIYIIYIVYIYILYIDSIYIYYIQYIIYIYYTVYYKYNCTYIYILYIYISMINPTLPSKLFLY